MDMVLFRQDVVLARAVRASAQHHAGRSRLFARLEFDGAWGFGEVAPQPYALHGDPGFDEVVVAARRLGATVAAIATREGAPPAWHRVGRLVGGRPPERFAAALVEMALLDRELRVEGRRAGELWPARQSTPTQATVSALDDEPWDVEGAARVRVKSAPGAWSRDARERLAGLEVPVIIDYNCSVGTDDEVIEQLEALRGVVEVVAVEQPYAAGNLVDHARLAARLARDFGVATSVDEGVRTLEDLRHVARYGAASLVCVKPARAGGLANARTMLARAHEWGLRAYLGGFFESPYARRVHRLLADHAVSEPSDVAEVALVGGVEDEASPVGVSFGLEPSPGMLAAATPLTVLEETGS